MQVECVEAGCVVGREGAVNVDCTLGSSGRPAGEMQQRWIVFGGRGQVASSEAAAMSSLKLSVPETGAAEPDSPMTITRRRVGIVSRIAASFLRYSDSVMSRTAPPPSRIRVAIGSGPNAENRGETIVPLRRAPITPGIEFRAAGGDDEHDVALADAEFAEHAGEPPGRVRQLVIGQIHTADRAGRGRGSHEP